MEEEVNELITELEEIKEDENVPENVKKACQLAIESLNNNKKELAIKLDSAISCLDSVTGDPNMPSYARTKIWNLVSRLEKI